LLGFFWGLTLGHLFGIVAESVELRRQALHGGQRFIGVPFLGEKLAADLCGAEPGIQTRRTKLRIRLALTIDERFDIGQQVGQMVFCPLPPTGREGVQTGETTGELMHAFPKRPTIPAAFAFHTPLAAATALFDGPCHAEPAGAAFQSLGRVNEQGLESIG
jgi:hypothetical protein